jgi:hypothetical protein
MKENKNPKVQAEAYESKSFFIKELTVKYKD